MTAEQRLILELADVLAIRLACAKCGAAVVIKPSDWQFMPSECPGCRVMWELPHIEGELPPLHRLIGSLKYLLEQSKVVAGRPQPPYQVKLEIRDPLAK